MRAFESFGSSARHRGRDISTKKPSGNLTGLKPAQLQGLQRIFRRRVPPAQVTTLELAQTLCGLSSEIKRQIGVFINRKGHITHVVVGDNEKIVLPDVGRHRAGQGRLRGVRLIHTHLRGEELTQDDLTDLALLSLDLVAAITANAQGLPDKIHCAHLLPENPQGDLWNVMPGCRVHELDVSFDELMRSLEEELSRRLRQTRRGHYEDRAIVVHLDKGDEESANNLAEILELCTTNKVEVVDQFTQRRPKPHPRFVIGRGKLDQLVLSSMQRGVEVLIFSSDLTPGQARALTDACELKVIDRTQLILDIFARHAKSRGGKLQVEMAQLRYTLPRLAAKNTGMSRLTGGIGGRGPGETKLEVNRRRVKERIQLLAKQLKQLSRHRATQRQRRNRANLPIISIVGYTNAGKSTLLNSLTRSNVLAEDKLFATLDPSSRRLRFPSEAEVIITDTVGFIRDLPEPLVAAFQATLEELADADLLLHVADASNPTMHAQVESVEKLLVDLGLSSLPRLLVLNKVDQITPEMAENLARRFNGVPISALDHATLKPLFTRMQTMIWLKN